MRSFNPTDEIVYMICVMGITMLLHLPHCLFYGCQVIINFLSSPIIHHRNLTSFFFFF